MQSSIKDLQTKGFVNLSYPKKLREKVLEAQELWRAFCALPENVKKSLPYNGNSDGVGYEYKDGSGVKGDTKENLDVTMGSRKWLEDNAAKIDNSVATNFISAAIDLVTVMKPIILDFAEQVEYQFAIKGFTEEVEQSEANFFIRFIHYFPNASVGKEVATAHVDQSGFTLHLFESKPGLQYLGYDKVWRDMPVSDTETVIIPDIQLQLLSEGKLTATCHRVIATSADERFSAVCFVQFKNKPKYDKVTNGRLQEKPAGFNYAMAHKEFRKLFK